MRERAHYARGEALVSDADCVDRRRKGLVRLESVEERWFVGCLRGEEMGIREGCVGCARPTLLWRETREP